jgi:hypothetical protein
LALTWVVLYVGSRSQRRKAERLIADLRAFGFSGANFTAVRDFALQHGGVVAEGVPSQSPPFTCTVQNCMFDAWLGFPFSRPPANQRLWHSLYPNLPYLGLRPWVIYVNFEVRDGVLARSSTHIGQLKRAGLGSYAELEYSILTERTPTFYRPPAGRSDDFVVSKPHVTGPPTEAWGAWTLQASNAPMNRVFDIDLRCLTTILHGCSGLSALAPSAWQHYQAALKSIP